MFGSSGGQNATGTLVLIELAGPGGALHIPTRKCYALTRGPLMVILGLPEHRLATPQSSHRMSIYSLYFFFAGFFPATAALNPAPTLN